MKDQLDINPQTKVGEMLDVYPQLEDVLLEISPTFVKLKNPILRRTVARVVSLRQAAEIGKVDIGEMVSKLRKAAGFDNSIEFGENIIGSESFPEWSFDKNDILLSFDAVDIINRGDSPMKEILAKVTQLSENKVMELITPFVPQPIIELLRTKGYICQYNKNDDKIYTYIKKK